MVLMSQHVSHLGSYEVVLESKKINLQLLVSILNLNYSINVHFSQFVNDRHLLNSTKSNYDIKI